MILSDTVKNEVLRTAVFGQTLNAVRKYVEECEHATIDMKMKKARAYYMMFHAFYGAITDADLQDQYETWCKLRYGENVIFKIDASAIVEIYKRRVDHDRKINKEP